MGATGALTSVRSVNDDDDMVIISSDGIIIRVHIADIPVYGRASAGVHVMRINGETKVIATAIINAADDDGEVTQITEAVEEAEDEPDDEISENKE